MYGQFDGRRLQRRRNPAMYLLLMCQFASRYCDGRLQNGCYQVHSYVAVKMEHGAPQEDGVVEVRRFSACTMWLQLDLIPGSHQVDQTLLCRVGPAWPGQAVRPCVENRVRDNAFQCVFSVIKTIFLLFFQITSAAQSTIWQLPSAEGGSCQVWPAYGSLV